MADPFGITGVIGVASQIIQVGVKLGIDWKEAPNDVRSFLGELGTLKTVLSETHTNISLNQEFKEAFEGRQSTVLSYLADGNSSSDPSTPGLISVCRIELEDLFNKLQKQSEGHRLGWDRLKGAFRSERTHAAVDDLQRRCRSLNSMTAIDNVTLTATTLAQVKDARNEIRQQFQDENKAMILEWLTPIDFAAQQSDNIERRYVGTGQWLLDCPEFQTWIQTENTTLFCPGLPGAGKTILASVVVEYLHKRFSTDPTIGVAFIPSITQRFRDDQRLEIRASDGDVADYLNGNMGQLPTFVKRNTDLQTQIRSKIVASVDGMFLLAKLHLQSLTGKRSPKAVKAALETLATGSSAYDTAYDEAVERIEGQLEDQSALAKDALSWIVCSKRPLQIVELQEALAVEQGMTELDAENRPEIEDVISACAGLLTIGEYSRVVRLVHYTTQEYFQRKKAKRLPGAEALVAAACVSYLSFDVFDTGQCKYQNELRDRLQNHPLYNYASVNWGYHVRDSHYVHEEVMCFLEDQERLGASAQVLFSPKTREVFNLVSNGNRSKQTQYLPGPSNHTCHWRKLEINAQNPEGETPLFVAVSRNFVDLTKDLLEYHGAKTSKDTHGQTILSVAVQMGHYDIVQYLVCCQVGQLDINEADMHGSTPLLYAIAKNKQDIISLLLDVDGVAYNQRGPGGKTPLLLAVGLRQDLTVKNLLERDEVEADPKDNEGRTPLSHAARNGDLSILGRLLEIGKVEADSRDDADRSPLSYAAGKGDLEIVRRLLQTGKVDADSRDRDGRTPLFYAAMASNKETVRFFLETERVDVNTLDVLHQSILLGMWPSYGLWEGPRFRTAETHAALMDMTELLIEIGGADPNVRDNRGRTLLWKALFHGHMELVEYLVNTGGINGPLNLRDIAGRTPMDAFANELDNEGVAMKSALVEICNGLERLGVKSKH
ncbi:ankyrin repeat protein [Colletotrichum simmondsii]|uniref:Ankyrin repeat protein n=1 Tax=Colletotrichum simmondsii TaxID=703756 RepID=A0A135T8Q7_9PEZI|nr:ankyrin repeat protein [Colletotrichum simmondsii]